MDDQDKLLEKRINDLEESIQSIENSCGLDFIREIKPPDYLKLSIDQIKKKNIEELTEISYVINMYSFHVQSVINKNRAIERWAKSKLDQVAAFYLPNIDQSHGFNERVLIAKNNSKAALKLNELIRQVSIRLDVLYNVPEQIRVIADSIKEFKFLAIRKDKEHGQ